MIVFKRDASQFQNQLGHDGVSWWRKGYKRVPTLFLLRKIEKKITIQIVDRDYN